MHTTKTTRPPNTLTGLECESLLDALRVAPHGYKQDRNRYRNYTMALIMLDTGLRVSELVHLRIDDLLYDRQPRTALEIRAEIAKNHTPRTIPLSGRVQQAVLQMSVSWWIPPRCQPASWAFFTFDPAFRITARQVQRIIAATAAAAIGKRVTPHALRHTFATRLMRTTNLRVVQACLGHQNLSSTQIYTHPTQQDLTDAINGLSDQ